MGWLMDFEEVMFDVWVDYQIVLVCVVELFIFFVKIVWLVEFDLVVIFVKVEVV